MANEKRLGFGEFLADIYGVIVAPRGRFRLIHERDAAWGSLVLLIVPAYFGMAFASAIFFKRDPFPGYSFLLPAVLATGLTLLKILSVHVLARLFESRGQRGATGGSFRDLIVVFGYTGVPALGAIVCASAAFLFAPGQLGYFVHSLRVVAISLLVATGIALFVWNLILMVLALRVVYAIGDIKILASVFIGPLLVGALPGLAAHTIFTEGKIEIACLRPVLSDRIIRFATADLAGDSGHDAKVKVHIDLLGYRWRAPERFDLVIFEPAGPAAAKPAGEPGAWQVIFGRRPDQLLFGRIVGVPGDTVGVVDGKLRINGQVWAEPYVTPEFQSAVSVADTRLAPSDYLILPEDRRMVDARRGDLVVPRARVYGRAMIRRWPLGWWWFRPSVFREPYPVSE